MSKREISTANAVAIIKKREGREFKAGGAWIYDNEIDRIEGSFENGDVIEVHDFDDYFLGYGFINEKSKIRIRMMSRKKDHPVTEELIEKKAEPLKDFDGPVYLRASEAELKRQGTIS